MFSPKELLRYDRQIKLPEVGLEGQKKLKKSSILVIGAGGLGSPSLLYLAAAGIGKIGIIDADKVDLSNLQRQILFDTEDCGLGKSQIAAEKLVALNPEIKLIPFKERLHKDNALQILKDFDVIADGSDNFATRYLVNDTCVLLGKPLISCSVQSFSFQLSVFNYPPSQQSVNYRDLFPEPPAPGESPNCAENGVLGATTGIAGCFMAVEAIKLITGIGNLLNSRLLIYNTLDHRTFQLEIQKDEHNLIKGLGDYSAEICNFAGKLKSVMKEVSVQELKDKLDKKEDFQLIDVREPHEFEIANLGGQLIPLGNIISESEKISRDKQVIIHCRSGARSATAIAELEKRFGFSNLYNLKGGINAYSKEIDSSIPSY